MIPFAYCILQSVRRYFVTSFMQWNYNPLVYCSLPALTRHTIVCIKFGFRFVVTRNFAIRCGSIASAWFWWNLVLSHVSNDCHGCTTSAWLLFGLCRCAFAHSLPLLPIRSIVGQSLSALIEIVSSLDNNGSSFWAKCTIHDERLSGWEKKRSGMCRNCWKQLHTRTLQSNYQIECISSAYFISPIMPSIVCPWVCLVDL